MQYDVLILIASIIVVILVVKNILSLLAREKINKKRKKIDINDIYKEHFSGIDNNEFNVIWRELSQAIKIDKEKMYPDDRLADMAKLYPLPEMFYEDLEEFMMKSGLVEINDKISEQFTIKDIVLLIYKSRQTEFMK